MKAKTVQDCLAKTPQKEGEIFSVTESTLLADLSREMAETGHWAAVVVKEGTGEFAGFVDMLDVVFHAAEVLPNGVESSEEDLRKVGPLFGEVAVGGIMNESHRNKKVCVRRTTPLSEVLKLMGHWKLPRVAVTDEDSSSRVVAVLSQSDMLAFAFTFIHWDGELPGERNIDMRVRNSSVPLICECLGLEICEPLVVQRECSALYALLAMKKHHVHAIGVVSRNGELLANFSAHDFVGLTHENLADLRKPVLNFLADHRRAFPERHRPKKYGKIVTHGPRPTIVVHESSTFETVMDKMVLSRLHRIWVVDDKMKPLRVLSLTDLLYFLSMENVLINKFK